MDKLLLRPIEAADALGVSRSRLYELLATHEIPSILIGKSRRIPRLSLERWIEQTEATQQGGQESGQNAAA